MNSRLVRFGDDDGDDNKNTLYRDINIKHSQYMAKETCAATKKKEQRGFDKKRMRERK